MRNVYSLSLGLDVVGVGSLADVQAAQLAIAKLTGAREAYIDSKSVVHATESGIPDIRVVPCACLTHEEFEELKAPRTEDVLEHDLESVTS